MSWSAFHICVKESAEALEFYQKVFDAKLLCRYDNADGTIYHSEIEAYGQIIMIAGSEENSITGNNMSFVMSFDEGEEELVKKIYDLLKDEANIIYPLSPCDYSPLMTNLIDKYGVHWFILIYKKKAARGLTHV